MKPVVLPAFLFIFPIMKNLFVSVFLVIVVFTARASDGLSTVGLDALDAVMRMDLSTSERLVEKLNQNSANKQQVAYFQQYKAFVAFLQADNKERYSEFLAIHNSTIGVVSRCSTDWQRLYYSNMMLRYAIARFMQSDNFSGAVALYNSHREMVKIGNDSETYLWKLKLIGIFNILWDKIPSNMRFWSSLAGLKGDFNLGVSQLLEYRQKVDCDALAAEAEIILLYASTLFQNDDNKTLIWDIDGGYRVDYPLVGYLYSGLLMRNNSGDEVLKMLGATVSASFDRFPLLRYQYGKLLLNGGYFDEAAAELNRFVGHYRGRSFRNDAMLQLGRTYYLKGDLKKAKSWVAQCVATLPASTSLDRQAVEESSGFSLWSPTLLRARLLFDFGRLGEAFRWASKPVDSDYDRIEQNYRLARISHRSGKTEDALRYYDLTISLSKGDTRYYGAYAALYGAEIMALQHNRDAALKYLSIASKLNNGSYGNDVNRRIEEMKKELK